MANERDRFVTLEKLNEKPAAPVEEKKVETIEAEPKEKFDSLSNRDALKEGIAQAKGEVREEAPEIKTEELTKKEVVAAVEADLEPPSEFNAEEKKAWANKDIAGIQKGIRRLNENRTRAISQAQNEARQAREEAKGFQDLDIMAKPFLESAIKRGQTRQQAYANAFKLINALQEADPVTAKAELKAAGIDFDKAPDSVPLNDLEAKIDALQKRQDAIDNEKKATQFQNTVQTFQAAFTELTALKTRTGELVFPDLLDDSDEGKEFAKRIGSRTEDPYFKQKVLQRFPDANFTVLVREAYKAELGRVSGEPVQVSQKSNQEHTERSRRAAASTPGKVVTRSEHSNLVGKLGNREAIRAARQYHKEH